LVLKSSQEITPSMEQSTYFNIKEINSGDISSEDLSKFNSVVIINKNRFNSKESTKLKEYIESGGGAVIYPGSATDIENYNNELMKQLDLPYIGARYNLPAPVKFDKIDFDNPVFEGIFKKETDSRNLNLESPGITNGIALGGGQNSVSVVTLLNGTNFMVEYSKGKGKLIMFAVPPDMSASDFPAKNLFSPVTIRSILYCSNINGIKPGIAGRDYFIEPGQFNLKSDTVSLSSGTKEEKPSKIIVPGNEELLNIGGNLNIVSNYSLTNAGMERYSIPVNFSKDESLTLRLKPAEIKDYVSNSYKLESNVISPEEQLTASIVDLRIGKDLWEYFLILAIIFLLIEYLLARSIIKSK
ncbi:MAG: hypothetical protein ABI543_14910, partial [Ignavibacteria bacterium]